MSETVHQVGDLSDLLDGQLRCFEDLDEHGVVVCRVAGELYALEDNCSHANTALSAGRLRGTSLTCPVHGACFDVRDGTHSGPPAFTGVPTYQVHETEYGVTIQRKTISDET